jgi:hypothetical protein
MTAFSSQCRYIIGFAGLSRFEFARRKGPLSRGCRAWKLGAPVCRQSAGGGIAAL